LATSQASDCGNLPVFPAATKVLSVIVAAVTRTPAEPLTPHLHTLQTRDLTRAPSFHWKRPNRSSLLFTCRPARFKRKDGIRDQG
jgi:hypothetical protein